MTALAARLAPLGVVLMLRPIEAGDEALFPDPSEPLSRRRASGAARWAAREALVALGGPADAALARSPRRYPIWPPGFVGSLAHDDEMAVAVVARGSDMRALGVDVEPARPLPSEVAEIALFGPELRDAARDPLCGRLIFTAKEAVYKAIHPLDGSPLEYEDIATNLVASRAQLRDGRELRLEYSAGERLVVVAWLAPR